MSEVLDDRHDPRAPLLTAEKVTATLGGRCVLDNVDVSLAAGRITVLLGPNGGGKTTLLRALLGHVPATGRIAWLGRPLADWSRRELARVAAYLPQAPSFEPGDRVIDVLRLGRLAHAGFLGLDSEADDTIVNAVAADLSLGDLLTRPLETLSGGQRQRVFLGRALVQRPQALLLDEPATYLDLRHQVDLYALLGRLAKEQGLAVLMASHDLNLASVHADDALILKAGKVIASGPIREVMTEPHLAAAFDLAVRCVHDGDRAVFIAG